MTNKTDKRLILLNPKDNIFVCCVKLSTGENIQIDGDNLTLTTDINLGHKLARYDIKNGEKILKYGVSIGSAKTDIKRVDHVHLHNIKSDYIPSHIRSGIIDNNIQTVEDSP